MNIYEIDQKIMDCVDMNTGEILDAEALEALEMEREAKLENVALWIKNLTARKDAIREEEKKLAERRRVTENKLESLKRYLADHLGDAGLETARVKLSWRSSQAIYIDETNPEYVKAIPAEFWKEQPPKLDKTGLKDAIKKGLQLEGVELITNRNLQIK